MSFFEEVAKKKKFIPGPNKYENTKHLNWTRKDFYMLGSRPKGKLISD